MLKKILIASSTLDIHYSLGSTLLKNGHTVLPAIKTIDVIDKADKYNFDLFILDKSKQVNAKKIIKILKKTKKFLNTPVILLCDSMEDKHTLDAWSIGADYCFVKPFQIEEVLNVISSLLLNKESNITERLLSKDFKLNQVEYV